VSRRLRPFSDLVVRLAGAHHRPTTVAAGAADSSHRANLRLHLKSSFVPRIFNFIEQAVAGQGKNQGERQQRRRQHPGRRLLPEHRPRNEVLNPVPDELRTCSQCGQPMHVLGHERCETLDIIPAQLIVSVRVDESLYRVQRCRWRLGGGHREPAAEDLFRELLVVQRTACAKHVVDTCRRVLVSSMSLLLAVLRREFETE
jgi:hypothetical protein